MEAALTPSMLSHTPKADPADWSSPTAKDSFGFNQGYGDGSYTESGMEADMHAHNATQAAFHADIAAKHAASTANHAAALAQWVSYLWQQHESLQSKVKELEDWKKRTLEDMRKLREEHKQLRKKFGGAEEKDEGVKKAASMPVSVQHPISPDSVAGPPGLDLPSPSAPVATQSSGAEADEDDSPDNEAATASAKEDSAETQNEGVVVKDGTVDSDICQRAEWRIGHLSVKLRGCMGRALVSPPFSAWGMEDLRLMIYPDQKESATGPRSRRQKELYNKKVSDGPLDGCLKLKVPNCPAPHVLKYYLTVGSDIGNRKGPFEHNFAECTVSEPAEFGMDWLLQVDGDGGLSVSVDIIKMAEA